MAVSLEVLPTFVLAQLYSNLIIFQYEDSVCFRR